MRCSVIAYNSLLYLIFLSYTQLFLAISSSITHFVYKIDPLIAEQARQDINNYIEHIPKKELLSFCELTDKIEKEFSFVKEIIIEKIAPNIVSITCKAHQPLGLINESFILIKQGSLHN
ncbi:MAG: hypothetical protein WCD44_04505, partial [Candidatus Babeliales bacterium]